MTKTFPFDNHQIARLFRNVSAAYEIKGENRFKIVAYDRAATAVEHATSQIKDLWEEKNLNTIPGIGTNIASHLDELFRTGKVRHFERVFSGLPGAMFEFLLIPGIGPRTAYKLAKLLKISKKEEAFSDLRQAAQAGKIRGIPSFGEQSEVKILEGLTQIGRQEKRLLLPMAYNYAQEILNHLKSCPEVLKADPLGSLRRKCATVGDIDIAVASKAPKKVVDCFIKFPKTKKVVEAGENKARILLPSNIQIDLMVEPPNSYGSLLQHFTGSKQHNIALREYAMKKGLSLSEHGMKTGKSQKMKQFSTEEEFYKALGMQWIPPELREDKGEIQLAKEFKLPRLVDLAEIKGDLHIHSDFEIEGSHDEGKSSLNQIYEKAVELGYEYIALSEHNPSTSKHTNNEIIDLVKKKKEYIEQFKYSREKTKDNRIKKVFIFNSLEIDIKPNGERAVPDKALEYMDFAVVSIHSSFEMEQEKMTQRILKALDHPKVKIFGHPTGRKIGERESYEVDWDKIFEFCAKKGKYLEVNSWPDRLDLPDTLIKEAIEAGVKLVINSDSHTLADMDLMMYGIWTARRGWAKGGDIINTLDYNKFTKLLT